MMTANWTTTPADAGRDLPEISAMYASRGRRSAPAVAVVDQAIAGVSLEISNQDSWEKWNATMGKGHIIHQHAFELAERWGRLMQAELKTGVSLDAIAASTLTRANFTANGLNYVRDGHCAIWNVASVLYTSWKHGKPLEYVVCKRPEIVRDYSAPYRIEAALGR